MTYKDPEKKRTKNRAYYAANREKLIEQERVRYAVNREKILEHRRVRRTANREKLLEQRRVYRAANREKINARERALRRADPLKFMERALAWRKANPEKAKQQRLAWYRSTRERRYELQRPQNAKRRARKHAAIGRFTAADWRALVARSPRCYWCGKKWTKSRRPTHDHIIALANGGANSPENSVCACFSCNARKGIAPFDPVSGQGVLV